MDAATAVEELGLHAAAVQLARGPDGREELIGFLATLLAAARAWSDEERRGEPGRLLSAMLDGAQLAVLGLDGDGW